MHALGCESCVFFAEAKTWKIAVYQLEQPRPLHVLFKAPESGQCPEKKNTVPGPVVPGVVPVWVTRLFSFISSR